MLKNILEKVLANKSLEKYEAYKAMKYLIEGNANDCQVASFLTALRMKGETIDEISGFCQAMIEKAEIVKTKHKDVVDTCGTGGDGKNTFNISTTAAFIAAGAGVIIAKHGNRSVSSICGSADVLEALGVNINLDKVKLSKCINETGICFMFAPNVYLAMKNVAKVRKDMKIRTVFNILGPIANPLMANRRVLGVFDENLVEKVIYSLKNMGVKRAFVVHGMDGLDEFSISGNSIVGYLNNGNIKKFIFNPEELGLKKFSVDKLKGGGTKENAQTLINILSGKEKGAREKSSVLNAAAAIFASGKTENMREAIDMASSSIESGRALSKLNELIDFTNKC